MVGGGMGPPRTAVDTPALWPSLAVPASGPVLALSRLSTRALLCRPRAVTWPVARPSQPAPARVLVSAYPGRLKKAAGCQPHLQPGGVSAYHASCWQHISGHLTTQPRTATVTGT